MDFANFLEDKLILGLSPSSRNFLLFAFIKWGKQTYLHSNVVDLSFSGITHA